MAYNMFYVYYDLQPFYTHKNTTPEMLRVLIILYGAEAWTLTKVTLNKLDAFKLWLYRKILRISWTEKITNIEVLRRMEKEN